MRRLPPVTSRFSPWALLVAGCAVVVVGGIAALAVGNVASRSERIASYVVRGSLAGVSLDLGEADVVVARGKPGASVAVQRVERFSFDRRPATKRTIDQGTFRVHSRCPSTILDDCSVRYRVLVPDNLPVEIRTDDGDVHLEGFQGSARVSTGDGDVDVDGFCGFSLEARTGAGRIGATAICPPSRMSLRTGSGAIEAVVPPGSYELEAESTSGGETVRGLTPVLDAPFSIQALSSSGRVLVEAGA